ncbi:serine hydrolase [Nocardiopsis prasina]|uniref:serine hydrolase n=1 Tax=Nocardiopsis prasina TaxID=2015 RepID=UPI000346C98A|nr:serine hydrolase [Nocardiopsis prasina]
MPRPPSADRRVRSVATAVLVALLVATSLPGALPGIDAVPHGDARIAQHAAPPRQSPTAALGGTALPPDERAALTERVEALDARHAAGFGIAVQDLRTGTTFSHHAHQRFPTASVAKLTVITMLLMSAEEEGRALTEDERDRAERMIRYSDNSVTDALYSRLGFTDGFRRHSRRLGFTGTEPDAGGSWGATTTTAADQVRLLRALYSDEGPLSEDDRAHVRGLMESVVPEQAWGVTAVAAPGDTVGVKNGWTPNESDGGAWIINSVGYVRGPDHEYLVAVLSEGHPGYAPGIELVEELVTEVTDAIEATPGPRDDLLLATGPSLGT